jgi:hypothetical protein
MRALFGDVGLVALSLIFGWVLWYTVREELNESFRRADIDVVIEPDAGIDVAPRSQKVALVVQGPRSAVDAFRSMPTPQLTRRVAASDLPAGSYEKRLTFTRDDFDLTASLGTDAVTVLEMDPPAVTVQAFRVEVQDKTVAPPEFQGATELGVRHALLGYSNTAKIRGSASVLSSFREIRTIIPKADLQRCVESMRENPKGVFPMALEIAPSQRGHFTLVEPKELWARVELSRVAEQEVVVPVQILADVSRGARPRRLQFAELNKPHFLAGDPPKVKVAVTGVPSAVAALTGASIRAFVLASDLPEDQRNGDVPVHVADLPAGIALAHDYSIYVEDAR